MADASRYKLIDLALPKGKDPQIHGFPKKTNFFDEVNVILSTQEKKTAAVGTKEVIHNRGDTGLFGTVFEAWAKHLNLRTSPEDWWLPVITRVAEAVDNQADMPELREYFRGGQAGKEKIKVMFPSFSIYNTDYTYLFNEFSKAIKERIKVPNYVETVSNSFSTTTPDQLISSQITIMKSFQKYFEYEATIFGCGIKAIEMSGTEQDWKLLQTKLQALKQLLTPIKKIVNLSAYLDTAEDVYAKLVKTYQNDPEMAQWWSTILIDSEDVEYGPSGMRQEEVKAYNGWLIHFCTGNSKKIKAKTLANGSCKELSCLSSCPVQISTLTGVSDNSTLVGGMLGFKVIKDTQNEVFSLQPVHSWCLMLPPKSPLRSH